MTSFISILEKLHYLNHPYLSGLSALILLSIGIFVLVKNPKSELYRAFFLMIFSISSWFFGNAFSMFYFNNLEISLLWFRIAYTTVPFICVSYYHFYLLQCKKKKRGIYLLYTVCFLEIVYLWLTEDYKYGAHALPNVGVFWQEFTRFTVFFTFGVIKYVVVSSFVVYGFYREFKKEQIPLKKTQLKYLFTAFAVIWGGVIEWSVAFGIPLHLAWIVVPPFAGIMAYVIVRYKAMEIDTVVHRTILWILTVFLLIIPAAFINLILEKITHPANILLRLTAICVLLALFVAYFNRLRPKIDHLFRRRKYDYQTILGKIAEMIATSLNIEGLTKELLLGIGETMYLRNSIFYILAKDKETFFPAGKWEYNKTIEIYSEKEKLRLPDDLKELIKNNSLVNWITEHRQILEREQIEVDPRYEEIKLDALAWLKEKEIELIIPLVFENATNALLCLGKRENLQTYSKKDIELLKKLGQDVSVTVFNALHYEDLAEKERLDEEIKMGKEIQTALLPRDLPRLPGINIGGFTLPAKEIGGDYYDFITPNGTGSLGIVIADVSGKGVAAGLVMAMIKTAVHAFSQQEISPKQILLRTDNIIKNSVGGYKGATMLYLLWDAGNKTITYSSAGHEQILIYRAATGAIEAILSGGIMLGIPINIDGLLEEKEFALAAGDKILLYTDGVTEAENQSGARFGLERLKESFKTNSSKQTNELLEAIKNEVYSFAGTRAQYDDITLVIIEKNG